MKRIVYGASSVILPAAAAMAESPDPYGDNAAVKRHLAMVCKLEHADTTSR